MTDHGPIRFIYPRQASPGQPIEIVVSYQDGHCEVLERDAQWAVQMIAELAAMVRGKLRG